MAEEQKPNEVDMAVEYLDLDAFKPKFYKRTRIEGVDYGVMHPSDLMFDQWIELLAVDKQLAAIEEEPGAAVIAGKKKIRMLIPELSEEVLDALNPKRVLMLLNFVTTEIRTEAERQAETLEAERGGNAVAEAGHDESAPAPSSSTSAS
jgi:hypothetical protein